MFLQASVILSTGGCLPQCMLGYHTHTPLEQTPSQEQTPPRTDTSTSRSDTPWDQTPPEQTPPRADTTPEQTAPWSRHPPGADTSPWSRHLPREQTPPPPRADSGIRSASGRYASYWNAFLFGWDVCRSLCGSWCGFTSWHQTCVHGLIHTKRKGTRGELSFGYAL